MVVGGLMLLIGYLSPIPAKSKSTSDSIDESKPEEPKTEEPKPEAPRIEGQV
jgi:hypothetical protein